LDLVAEIEAIEQDLLNPTSWDNIVSFMPWIGANVGTKKNIEAASFAADINNQVDKIMLDKIATGKTDDEIWEERFAARDAKDAADKIAEDKRYANIERLRKLARENDWAEEDARYAKILAEKDARDAAKRKADDEYYAAIFAKLAEREEEESFKSSYEAPSKLNFGLL